MSNPVPPVGPAPLDAQIEQFSEAVLEMLPLHGEAALEHMARYENSPEAQLALLSSVEKLLTMREIPNSSRVTVDVDEEGGEKLAAQLEETLLLIGYPNVIGSWESRRGTRTVYESDAGDDIIVFKYKRKPEIAFIVDDIHGEGERAV